MQEDIPMSNASTDKKKKSKNVGSNADAGSNDASKVIHKEEKRKDKITGRGES